MATEGAFSGADGSAGLRVALDTGDRLYTIGDMARRLPSQRECSDARKGEVNRREFDNRFTYSEKLEPAPRLHKERARNHSTESRSKHGDQI